MPVPRRIGPALRRLKEASGLSYEDLGEILGKKRTTVATLCENNSNPQWGSIADFLNALELSVSDLAEEIRDPGGLRKTVAELQRQVEELTRPGPPLVLRGLKRDIDD